VIGQELVKSIIILVKSRCRQMVDLASGRTWTFYYLPEKKTALKTYKDGKLHGEVTYSFLRSPNRVKRPERGRNTDSDLVLLPEREIKKQRVF